MCLVVKVKFDAVKMSIAEEAGMLGPSVSSVQSLSHVWLCDPMDASMPAFHPLPSLTACSNPCSLSQWSHPTILPSVIPFTCCLQSFPASESFLFFSFFIYFIYLFFFLESFLRSQFFTSVVKVLEPSPLPMNIQDWFPLGLTGLISLKSKVHESR